MASLGGLRRHRRWPIPLPTCDPRRRRVPRLGISPRRDPHRRGARPGHPICQGVDPTFTLTDEVYLFPVLEDRVRPLMRSAYDFVDTNFYSADRAIRGTRNDRTGWRHPWGSNLVAWTRTVGVRRSPTSSSATARHLRRPELSPHPCQRDPLGRRPPISTSVAMSETGVWLRSLIGTASDLAVLADPVGLAELGLLDLAGARRREFVEEVDRPRHLVAGEQLAAVRRAVRRRARRRQAMPSVTATIALTSSPNSSFGTPITATSATESWPPSTPSISAG